VIVIAMSACAPLQQYRSDYKLCISHTRPSASGCESHALQRYEDAGHGYTLGFIEFDDQGLLFDRGQMKAVVREINEQAAERDLLIVVFMHGWKHSAAAGDENIRTFRQVLASLSEAEHSLSRITNEPRREVVGVYLGWRGGSVTVPVLRELTFWDRKNTAHKVGHIGVTEVLNRLERIKRDKDSLTRHGSRTRFVVVGHSFGGAAVYAALSQILEAGFVHTVGPPGTETNVAGFGNLVVLINPAFEALLLAPLSDMSTERGHYFESQLPVLAILTSEADDATRLAFPAGRIFSTVFEKEGNTRRWNATTKQEEIIDEEDANTTAVGHFEPYKTHFLHATDAPEAALAKQNRSGSVQRFFEAGAGWRQDRPGSRIRLNGSVLERTDRSAGRNPYLIVRVDREIIADHNDISNPRMVEFIKQLILISSQTPEQTETIQMRMDP
jgi:hypothetical protein